MHKQLVFEPIALLIYLAVAVIMAIVLDVAGLNDGINLAITMALLGTLFVIDRAILYKTKQTLLERFVSSLSLNSAGDQQALGIEIDATVKSEVDSSELATTPTTTSAPLLKVLIADNKQKFREGIKHRLEQETGIQVIAEADTAAATITAVETSQPDIAILDVRLPDKSGIELAQSLREKWPDLKILILTGHDFDQFVTAFTRIGIDGYMLKDAPQESLIQALRDIGAGGVVLPPNIASKVMRGYASPATGRDTDLWELTIREIDVLELLFQGQTNAEIAKKLSISIRTVEAHVRNLMTKLGAQSRTDAVRIALDKGLVK